MIMGKNLKKFQHHQWGSIVGNEKNIRLAVLKDEVALWEKRCGNEPDNIPYLGYIRDSMNGRIKEITEEL